MGSRAEIESKGPGPALSELVTPCALVDRQLLTRNIERMNDAAARAGVPLRPHVKTVKCIEIARQMVKGHTGGITVSTLAEAQYFADAGFKDVLYAVGIAPAKLHEVAELRSCGIDLKVILDNVETASAVCEWAAAQRVHLSVLAEINADDHRGGFDPGAPDLIAAARLLDQGDFTRFTGVMTHAGGSYDCRTEAALKAMAVQERDAVLTSAGRLREAGMVSQIISVGSTPTALHAPTLAPVTEIRAGVYPFMDLFQAGLGLCSPADIALSVLATVIGHKPRLNRLLVDAGALALSKDRGTASQQNDCGYGLVCDLSGRLHNQLRVASVNQEHGLITSHDRSPLDFGAWPIGSQLRILPNHACMTAAAYHEYEVLDGAAGGGRTRWPRCGGWSAR